MILLPIIRSYHWWRASEKVWVSLILWPVPEGMDGGLLTSVKTGLTTDFGLELLLITDFGGTPLRPSFLWRSKESYELITR